MKRLLTVAVACTVCSPAFAFFWGNQTTITGYYVYAHGGAYIKTPSNQNPDSCQYSAYLALDTSALFFKELYATIIAAHASGSTVTLNYDGCLNGYPKIVSVAVPKVW